MKWADHIYLTKIAARNRNFPITEELIEGVKYPDEVGETGGAVLGVDVGYPHHSDTKKRVDILVESLRGIKLEEGEVDHFALGALCHLVQDSEVVPSNHPDHQAMQDGIRNTLYSPDPADKGQELWDGYVTQTGNIASLTSKQSVDSEEALRQGFLKTDQVLGSISRKRELPQEYVEEYEKEKKDLEERDKSIKLYWLFTYLSLGAPFFALFDRKAFFQKDIVKKYSFVKENLLYKGVISFLGLFLTSLSSYLGVIDTFTKSVVDALKLPAFFSQPIFQLSQGHVDLFSILILTSFLLPFMGQVIAVFFPIEGEIRKQCDWFKFPGEG